MRMNVIKQASILSIGLLTACAPPKPASFAPANIPMPVEKREQQTATVSSWVVTGAMAAKNQQKSWTASVNWQQQGANKYQIRLFGPLGGGTVLIEKDGNLVTLKDGPKTKTANNADELLQSETGIRLPVSKLYYWVRGIPAPGKVQSAKYDEYNHLTYLKQSGYTVEYLRYTSVKNIDLPSKITMQGNGITIKFVIKNWSV